MFFHVYVAIRISPGDRPANLCIFEIANIGMALPKGSVVFRTCLVNSIGLWILSARIECQVLHCAVDKVCGDCRPDADGGPAA